MRSKTCTEPSNPSSASQSLAGSWGSAQGMARNLERNHRQRRHRFRRNLGRGRRRRSGHHLRGLDADGQVRRYVSRRDVGCSQGSECLERHMEGAQPLGQGVFRDLASPFGTTCFRPLSGPVRVCFEQNGRWDLADGCCVLRRLVHSGFPAPLKLFTGGRRIFGDAPRERPPALCKVDVSLRAPPT